MLNTAIRGSPNTDPTSHVNFGLVWLRPGEFPRQIQFGFNLNWKVWQALLALSCLKIAGLWAL